MRGTIAIVFNKRVRIAVSELHLAMETPPE
jgi:hypothetical protein